MSNRALSWAFRQKLKSGPKFILVALADHADERHSCFPSYERLADMTGYKERAIASHISALEAAGLLTREGVSRADGKRLGTRYYLAVDSHLQNMQADATPPAKSAKATCKKRHIHLQNMQGYRGNPQENPQREPVVVEGAREPDLLDRLASALREATGNAVDWQSPGIAVLSIPLGWMMQADAPDLELDVVPAIAAICQSRDGPPIRSWNYFRAAVFEARDRRLTPNPEPKARHDHANRTATNRHRKSDELDEGTRLAIAQLEPFSSRAVSG